MYVYMRPLLIIYPFLIATNLSKKSGNSAECKQSPPKIHGIRKPLRRTVNAKPSKFQSCVGSALDTTRIPNLRCDDSQETWTIGMAHCMGDTLTI